MTARTHSENVTRFQCKQLLSEAVRQEASDIHLEPDGQRLVLMAIVIGFLMMALLMPVFISSGRFN